MFDDLVKHFGERLVFMDVAGIEAGRDFRKAIEESIAQCGVLLVVMGPEWLNAKDERGARRLDDPADFVRIETAAALRRDIPVIPVLVHGAQMPRAEELPEGVKDLAYRNCIELTHARWKSDVQLLVEALRRVVVDNAQPASRTGSSPSVAAAGQGVAYEQVRRTSKQESASSAQIDPAAMQRVSRELALHIGPIADVMVKRAAAGCTSIEDLYLKVSEEIESRAEREIFLQRRALNSSIQFPDARAVSLANSASGTPASAVPLRNDVWSASVPSANTAGLSSRSKYLFLIGGGFIVLILVFFFATRFAPQRETNSSQNATNSPQNTHTAESPPAAADVPASAAGGDVSGAGRGGVTDGAIGSNPGTAPSAPSKPANPQRVRISQAVLAGLLASKVLPVYPTTAQQAHVQGMVVLQAEISKDGMVESLRGISGHPLLIPAAIEAVKQWRYKPYVMNGKPTAVNSEIVVNFTLKNQ